MMRVVAACLFSVLVVVSVHGQKRPDSRLVYLQRRAQRIMEQLNFKFAITHLESVIKQYPDDAATRMMLGESHYALDRWSEAVAAFGEGASRDESMIPRVPRYPLALVKLGRLDDAFALYVKMIELAKNDGQRSQGWFGQGLVMIHRGQTAKALKLLERAHELNPRSRKVSCRLGMLFRREGKLERAVELFKQVIDAYGLHESAIHNLSMCYVQLGKRDEARRWQLRHREAREATEEIGRMKTALAKRTRRSDDLATDRGHLLPIPLLRHGARPLQGRSSPPTPWTPSRE